MSAHDKIASMTHAEQIASQLNVRASQVTAVIRLLDGLYPSGQLRNRQAKVNALHLPRRSLSGCPSLVNVRLGPREETRYCHIGVTN